MVTSNTVIKNFFWRFFERCGSQLISLLVFYVLARLLDPAAYGMIALVSVFIIILDVFVNSGLGNALIQKKNADNVDFSTVFYFNVLVSLVLYAVLFGVAPFIAVFYKIPELSPVIRVLGLSIVIAGIRNIQQAYVSRNLVFKKMFFATMCANVSSAIIGISMAYNGLGVWALVAQHLTSLIVGTIFLWIVVGWRPNFLFSMNRLKSLFSFSWKLLISSLLDQGYNQLRQLIIGRIYTARDLAFYNQGNHLPNLIVTNINTSIDSVLFPSMSAEQDDINCLRNMTRRSISVSTYIMMPCMMGLAVSAEPFVRLVLTEKWLPCVPFVYVFCFSYAFYPVHTANLNAIKALGRSDLFLILEIIKKVVGIVAILLTMNISVMAMAYSLVVTSVLSQVVNSWPNKKLLGYSYLEQLKDIFPHMMITLLMGALVYCVKFVIDADALVLITQVLLGVALYIGLSIVFKNESFCYIKQKIRKSA